MEMTMSEDVKPVKIDDDLRLPLCVYCGERLGTWKRCVDEGLGVHAYLLPMVLTVVNYDKDGINLS